MPLFFAIVGSTTTLSFEDSVGKPVLRVFVTILLLVSTLSAENLYQK